MVETYLVYNSVLLFSFLFAYIAERSYDVKVEMLARILSALVLILPVALRDFRVGTDTLTYVSVFQSGSNVLEHFEWGFLALCELLKDWGLGERSVLWMMGLLTFLPVCMILPKKKLSVSMFFYVVTVYFLVLSGSRQVMSLSFIIWALASLRSKRHPRLKYCILVLMASSIHTSAFVYLPLVCIYKLTPSPKLYGVLIGLLIFVVFTFDVVGMIWNIPWIMESDYGNYAISRYNSETELGSGYGVAIRLIFPCLFLYLLNRIYRRFEVLPLMGFICVAYIFSYLLALQVAIFSRLVACFLIVQFMLPCYIFQVLSRRYRVIFQLMFVLLYLLIYEQGIATNLRILGSGLGVTPYTFCFQ
ncbi:EpsG family protein [uncultured Parabacteroides sp.]|uniref:EpsG family protein n=1 Tax=uncultured Parabacteroides sp. TaxID=512312 RepID=UPI002630535C|nr:EpsG family protein [uncultured Parabacteroides sp.]